MTINELTKLGIAVPTAMLDAQAVREALLGTTVFGTDDDLVALDTAIRARTLSPAEALAQLTVAGDAMVRRAALKTAASQLVAACDASDAAAMKDCADELVAAVKPKVEHFGKTLADAVANIGPHPDNHLVAKLGPGALATFARWRDANTALQQVRIAVGALYGRPGAMPATAWVALDGFNAAALARLDQCGGSFADMTAAGFTLTLNSPADLRAKADELARVNADRQRVSTGHSDPR